jgi:serine/threonine-protein kinase
MEYVEGRSLAEMLREDGPLPAATAVEIATDIAAALGAAHTTGMLHRDIKPGNILVTPSGLVKVADWGIGRAMDAAVEENLTQTGAVMGTATYFSPEQAQGLPLDNRSDLYALGVVLYEMVTGRPPFQGDSPVAIAYKHVQEPPRPPRSINANVPPELEAITMQLLEKRPDDRYANAEDLRADLRRYREGFRVHAMSREMAPAAAVAGATQAVPTIEETSAVPTSYHVDEPDGGGWYQEPPREKRSWGFLVALVLLLAVLGGLLYLLASTLGIFDEEEGDVDQVEVPRVVDLPVDQARQLLEDAGLEVVETAEQVADAARVGLVLSQNPENGIRVDEGTEVTIVVGSQNTFAMPPLAGSTPEQARNTLQGLGFTGEIREEVQDSTDVDEGQIITTQPAAGEQVATTATITLVVSGGPPQTEIPTCEGVSAGECAERLTAAGFTPQIVQESSSTVPEGQVIGTDPPAGSLADNGATVRVIESAGPAVVEVPSVEGLDEGAAIQALEDSGFEVSTVRQDTLNPAEDGIVLDQNPSGNSTAEAGSTVTIVVGSLLTDVGD